MLTTSRSAALTSKERLAEIAALLADAIINSQAQSGHLVSSFESLSESRGERLDLSANTGLSVHACSTSAPQPPNPGVQHGA